MNNLSKTNENDSAPKQELVNLRERLIFGLAGGGQNFSYALVNRFLMYFYINVFNINPGTISLLIFIEGIWDIINNPLMGAVVDKTRSRHGRMRFYLRTFVWPLAVMTCFLFAGPILFPNASDTTKTVYMIITYFLWETFYTMTDVPFWGLTAAISPNPDDRAKTATAINVIQQVFGYIPMVVLPVIMDLAAEQYTELNLKNVFFSFGLVAGIFGIGLFSLSGFFVKERVAQSEDRPSFKESFSLIIKNKPLRLLLTSDLIRTASGVGHAISTYYFIDVLGYASLSFIAYIPAAITSALSFLLIPIIRKRMTNKQIILTVYFGAGILQLILFLIGCKYYSTANVIAPLIMAFGAIISLWDGVMGVVYNGMLAETADYSEWKTGKRSEGISFAMRTTTSKIYGTIAQSLMALILSAIGYVTSESSARVQQTPQVQFLLWTVFSLVPAVIGLLSAIPFFFYDLVGKKKEAMFQELEQRRKDVL